MSRRIDRRKKNKYILDSMQKEVIDMGELLISLGLIELVSYEEYMEKICEMEERMDTDEWN